MKLAIYESTAYVSAFADSWRTRSRLIRVSGLLQTEWGKFATFKGILLPNYVGSEDRDGSMWNFHFKCFSFCVL